MSNEEHPNQPGQQGVQDGSAGPDPRYGGWEPTPQSGEYDADATAFVQLPPEDLANIPLAAPGHGYVPPMILPLTPAAGLDPAATGSWVIQTQTQQAQAEQRAQEAAAAQESGAVQWPEPNRQDGYTGPYQDTSHATAQWNFTEAIAEVEAEQPAGEAAHPGHADLAGHTAPTGHTGQWTIPVADGDLPDESGEFLASAHTPQWYTDTPPPATLPGGAPAPWAAPEPRPEAEREPEPEGMTPDGAPTAEHSTQAHPSATTAEAAAAPEAAATAEAEAEPEAEGEPAAPDAPTDADAPAGATRAPDTDADAPMDVTQDAPADGTPDAATDAAHAPEAPAPSAAAHPLAPSEHPSASYVLHVNGMDRPVGDAWIGESLLYVLRERLGLAGAKDGCSQGECGACNVQVDGRLVASCLVPAATTAGSEVRTVEGLAVDGEPSDVQRALSACGAVQCGFCIPGMAMTVHDLLEGNHAPSELETRQALCGNLCRCSGYRGVLDAVADVVAAREASAEAAAPAPDEARIPHQAEPGAGGVQQQPYPHEGEAL
ncbi:(2Fe-2S)-binding protein [Streptomyces sp. WZ.A104]|uniref:(2Fe-2S)-binding protein n=1 Tax=Streptomyces sp. WZ.A104 TaxID=2023771 RepID=UPI000BBBA03F|nr:(2Fe-2S)-binding protein [Streptomyces sp. WZ.A104]PCG82702.1 (2Fe-2S)-binding protein [Streptomyces sp. WZ.A104]